MEQAGQLPMDQQVVVEVILLLVHFLPPMVGLMVLGVPQPAEVVGVEEALEVLDPAQLGGHHNKEPIKRAVVDQAHPLSLLVVFQNTVVEEDQQEVEELIKLLLVLVEVQFLGHQEVEGEEVSILRVRQHMLEEQAEILTLILQAVEEQGEQEAMEELQEQGQQAQRIPLVLVQVVEGVEVEVAQVVVLAGQVEQVGHQEVEVVVEGGLHKMLTGETVLAGQVE